jgi:hypothetical protein
MVNIFLLFVRLFSSFISNTSIVSINFSANLDAQNAGNGISELQISNIFWETMPPDPPPPFIPGMSVTWPSAIAVHL